jgi:hypothetical protein
MLNQDQTLKMNFIHVISFILLKIQQNSLFNLFMKFPKQKSNETIFHNWEDFDIAFSS